MRRWSRQRLRAWMLVVVAVAVALGAYRAAADRRAARQAASRRFIDLVDSAIAAQARGERRDITPDNNPRVLRHDELLRAAARIDDAPSQ